MARDVTDAEPLQSRDDLVAWIAAGEKPRSEWRLGVEHEKVPFYREDLRPVPYEGERGIRALIEGLGRLNGWEPILDEGNPIGLADTAGGGAISLEPGGQFELSGAPLASVHEVEAELARHLDETSRVASPLGIGFLTLGMSPKWTRPETPVMPKSRYRIMAGYMPKVGSGGLDMMLRTATVQVNLDFATEADMVKKLRVSLALQPVATALFANSPFTDGRPNGLRTMRSEIWRDTDAARTGMLPFAFEPGMGYERYVDYALDVPLYFIKRGETYHDVSGGSFRELMDGRLAALPGERATRSDWANHLGTIFPEVRLKRFLEMRGSDVGPPAMIAAEAALWAGLLYDEASLDGAWSLVERWTATEREALRDAVPKQALAARIAGRSLREVSAEMLDLAEAGLRRRALLDGEGRDETRHLACLREIVAAGETQADALLARYRSEWSGSIDPVFRENAF